MSKQNAILPVATKRARHSGSFTIDWHDGLTRLHVTTAARLPRSIHAGKCNESTFLSRLFVGAVLTMFLASCSSENDAPPHNPLDETLEEGALVLDGIDEEGLNATTTPLRFVLKKSSFETNPAEIKVTINGKLVDAASFQMTAAQILVPAQLNEGRNDIVFKAYDKIGRPLHLQKTIWAGSNTLAVEIRDSAGTLVSGAVDVKLQLSDNAEITEKLSVSEGRATFTNVPSRTVILEARTLDNSSGTAGAYGNDGAVKIELLKFHEPDPTENNDFSQGLAGYVYGSSPVTLVPHQELVGPTHLPPATASSAAPASSRQARHQVLGRKSAAVAAANAQDMDAALSTSGEGPQRMSRTFKIKPGTSSVSVRYRFVTSEVPGGYFGSEYNDYFSVAIRSGAGGAITESNSMNGLGLAAFDAGGSTSWKTVKLKTDKEGDEVQVDLTVANVADDLLDSQLIVDLILEKDEVTPQLSWNPNEGGLKLTYKVGKKQLENDVNIDIYWASGPALSNRIGPAITTIVVPAGTPAGTTGTRNIAGSSLQNDPAGVTHVISAVSEDAVGPVADVRILYGPNADPGASVRQWPMP